MSSVADIAMRVGRQPLGGGLGDVLPPSLFQNEISRVLRGRGAYDAGGGGSP